MTKRVTKENWTVWDWPVRLMHWTLVISMTAAWITSDMSGAVHEYLGYLTGALVLLRVMWGYGGNSYARFSQFLKSWATTRQYFAQVLTASAPRYLGHNPLGGWMVVALLSCVSLLSITGWAMNTDLLWGYAWPVRIHVALAWLTCGLVALHVLGVLFTSWQHRENLVKAMFTGKKAQPEPHDVS